MMHLLRTVDSMYRSGATVLRRRYARKKAAPLDDDASVREALHATLWFVAIVTLVLWAGAAIA